MSVPTNIYARNTPSEWLPGDEGYVPVEDPPDSFFHVIATPPGTDEKMALMIHLAYERGQSLDLVAGRRYLVNAVDGADAMAQVERIEKQIAENDPEHQVKHDGIPWTASVVIVADALIHAGRDPEPAAFEEAFVLDQEKAVRRRQRAVEAGLA